MAKLVAFKALATGASNALASEVVSSVKGDASDESQDEIHKNGRGWFSAPSAPDETNIHSREGRVRALMDLK